MENLKNCKIGVIAFPIYYPAEYRVVLGELTDNRDVDFLHTIHKNLEYFSTFTITISKGEIESTTAETQFLTCITPIVKMDNKPPYNEIIQYYPPRLYDLTCMVPLFEDSPVSLISFSNKSVYHIVFILLVPNNPIIRGKIIQNCFEILGTDKKGYFYLIGKKDHNTRVKNYLISKGVKTDLINSEIKGVDITLIDAAGIAYSMGPDKIYIAVESKSFPVIKKTILHLRNKEDIPSINFSFIGE